MNVHHAIQVDNAAEFLRKSLRVNAVFSALSGLAFALASGPVAAFLGNVHPSIVLLVGVQLLFFAGVLVWLSSRSEIPPSLAIGVVVADLLWVVATIIVVYAGLFTRGGEVLAAILAGVVLAMAMLQSIGVRRMGAVRVEVQS
jgi:hypothetical protein